MARRGAPTTAASDRSRGTAWQVYPYLIVCRERSVQELLLRLSVSENGNIRPFEALLHVKVAKGVPVETEFVSIRKLASP